MAKECIVMNYNEKSLNLINTQREFLKTNHSELFSRILNIEELYSTYNFMIFNLPKFKMDNDELFHDIWNKNQINCSRVRTDIASPYDIDSTPRFRALDILEAMPERKRIWTTNYMDLSAKFPLFYQQMYDCLPFSKINYVRLWQSIGPINMHRDDSWWYVNAPTEIRIMIYDENDSGTLKIQPELIPEDLKYINMPDESNSFAFNNIRCLHGSIKNDKEKILACITGTFDLDKLQKLFENSIGKFNNSDNQTLNDPYTKLLFR